MRREEGGTSEKRRELAHRENTLLEQRQQIDTEEEQRGLLGRRLGARQRAAQRERIREELDQIEAERQPINDAEGLARQWRDTQNQRRETLVAWVRDLPEGLDAATAHAEAVKRWGLGVDAAEAADQWATAEQERARNRAIQEWWQNLADGLTADQVRADAEQRLGPDIDTAVLADDYRHEQIRRATAWVQSRPGRVHTRISSNRRRRKVRDR